MHTTDVLYRYDVPVCGRVCGRTCSVEMNGRPEYWRFPSPDQQHAFCRAYMEELLDGDAGAGAGGAGSSSAGGSAMVAQRQAQVEAAAQDLLEESRKFVLVNHW